MRKGHPPYLVCEYGFIYRLHGNISLFVKSHLLHFRGAPTSQMGMTTVWRPRVRIAVPNVGDAEGEVDNPRGGEQEGTKRKRAPPTKGPCEHGVKAARTARCAALVRTVVGAVSARSAVGHQSASTVVIALSARSAVGHQSASTVVIALHARSAVGSSICEHGRERHTARSAVGHNMRARS